MADRTVVRVVLADDHPLIIEGLTALLEHESDIRVVAVTSDGVAAWRATVELQPDVLVLDFSLPALNGAETAARVRADCPGVKIVAFTVHEEEVYVLQLLRAGVSGYVLKRSASAELVRALRTVAAGGTYLDPAVAHGVVRSFVTVSSGASGMQAVLSERERAVLNRIARGFSNKEIAASLEISVKTVETYKARASEKLGLQSRVDIVRYAAREGWL